MIQAIKSFAAVRRVCAEKVSKKVLKVFIDVIFRKFLIKVRLRFKLFIVLTFNTSNRSLLSNRFGGM